MLLFCLFQNINQQLPRWLRGQLAGCDVNPTPPRLSGWSLRQPFVPAQSSEMQAGTSHRGGEGTQMHKECCKWGQEEKLAADHICAHRVTKENSRITTHVQNESEHVKNQIVEWKQMPINYGCSL